MLKYYCQPDGGQWNVPVHVLKTDAVMGFSIVKGHDLIGSYVDDAGDNYAVVDTNYLHDTPQ